MSSFTKLESPNRFIVLLRRRIRKKENSPSRAIGMRKKSIYGYKKRIMLQNYGSVLNRVVRNKKAKTKDISPAKRNGRKSSSFWV